MAIILGTYREPDQNGRVSIARKVDFPSQASQAQYLRALVKVYRNQWPIREKAVNIVRDAGVPARDQVGQALAIGQWLKDRLYYVLEPEETFTTPTCTLRVMFGDCDDGSSLGATLCESIGIPCGLVCVGPWPEYKHIYPQAVAQTRSGPRVIPLDWTLSAPIGTDPRAIVRRRWPIRGHARKF